MVEGCWMAGDCWPREPAGGRRTWPIRIWGWAKTTRVCLILCCHPEAVFAKVVSTTGPSWMLIPKIDAFTEVEYLVALYCLVPCCHMFSGCGTGHGLKSWSSGNAACVSFRWTLWRGTVSSVNTYVVDFGNSVLQNLSFQVALDFVQSWGVLGKATCFVILAFGWLVRKSQADIPSDLFTVWCKISNS